MKINIVIGAIVVLAVAIGGYLLFKGSSDTVVVNPQENTPEEQMPVEPNNGIGDGAEPLDAILAEGPETVIGASVDGNDIVAYHYGTGDTELLFVGGTHAGYSGNTVLVAYELMDYLEENPSLIPNNVKVTVIPVLNPDGLEKVYGTTERFDVKDAPTDHSVTTAGRFNANNVDLNRNFDCEWAASGTWQSKTVSGGSKPFSEPESSAVRDYVYTHDIAGAVVWYSAAGGVFSSSCQNGVSTETKALTNIYASAAGYKAYEEFNFYEITGDMVNWFAKENIPAISVLMTDHENTEWTKNKKGIDAVLNHYAE